MSLFRRCFEMMLLFCFVLILATGCKKDDSNPTESNSTAFVGTWKLTLISTTYSGQPITMSPSDAGIQMTIVNKSDATFTMTTTDSNGATTYTGTYIKTDTNLTLKYSDNTSSTFAYTLSGNTLSIKDYPYTHPLFGALLLKLDFTKQ
jgi:hypothetical protein